MQALNFAPNMGPRFRNSLLDRRRQVMTATRAAATATICKGVKQIIIWHFFLFLSWEV